MIEGAGRLVNEMGWALDMMGIPFYSGSNMNGAGSTFARETFALGFGFFWYWTFSDASASG